MSGVLGALLMLWVPSAQARVSATAEYKVFTVILVTIIASLPAVWRVGQDLLRKLGITPGEELRSPQGIAALAGVAIVVVAELVAGRYARGISPLAARSHVVTIYGRLSIGAIYASTLTATVPTFLAMWVCYRKLGSLLGTSRSAAERIVPLLTMRECLMTGLTTVGLLVSAGVLAAGAQRQVALADPADSSPYPAAYVLIWGLAFSGLLLVNFLPAFRRLIDVCNATIDRSLPLLMPKASQWQARLQERKDLADLLQVTRGFKDILNSSILILAPLISSTVSLFLPAQK